MTDLSTSTTALDKTTLMLLYDYIQALLPTLGNANDPSETVDTSSEDAKLSVQLSNDQSISKPRAELLWALQDQQALSELRPLLSNIQQKNNAIDGNKEETVKQAALFTLQQLAMQPQPQRYQLACFWLPNLSAETLQQYIPLLMRYRDLYAAHMLVALDEALDLRAYGFTPLDILEDNQCSMDAPSRLLRSKSSFVLWQFNLYDYKKLPNWLNSDYWANPENWDKHRW